MKLALSNGPLSKFYISGALDDWNSYIFRNVFHANRTMNNVQTEWKLTPIHFRQKYERTDEFGYMKFGPESHFVSSSSLWVRTMLPRRLITTRSLNKILQIQNMLFSIYRCTEDWMVQIIIYNYVKWNLIFKAIELQWYFREFWM
jgi:hypothetical protein